MDASIPLRKGKKIITEAEERRDRGNGASLLGGKNGEQVLRVEVARPSKERFCTEH